MTATRPSSRVWRLIRWLLVFMVAGMGLTVWLRFAPNRQDPVYQGRRPGQWLRGHPREYVPVVQAVGTNALPYLLAELQITDPAWLCWAEHRVRSFEIGPPWDTAPVRHYHARLALQILDTNSNVSLAKGPAPLVVSGSHSVGEQPLKHEVNNVSPNKPDPGGER